MKEPRAQSRVVAILQARMGSTRLPGKVLAPLLGRPMLGCIIERLRLSSRVNDLVVATTTKLQDEPVRLLARSLNVPCYCGSEDDVLDRYYWAAKLVQAAVVVRLTADNPLLDGAFVDWVLEQFFAADPPQAYIDSTRSKTFPLGLSVEAFTFEALERAWREDGDMSTREHVTPYIYRHPELFRSSSLSNDECLSHMRWTVDTPEDLAFVRRIYEHFGDGRFSWREALELLKKRPELLEINRHVEQVNV